MGEPARKSATYEDLFELADNEIGEIIDGELIVSPQPRPRHIRASDVIGTALRRHFDFDPDDPDGPAGGWWILTEPELHLDGQILIPDLAGWRETRMLELPDDEAFLTLPPDWVCEVLSPSTMRLDRLEKKRKYAENGVEFIWLVDPLNKTLEVLRLEGRQYLEVDVHQGDVRVRAMPFEAVELNLELWWRRTKRRPNVPAGPPGPESG